MLPLLPPMGRILFMFLSLVVCQLVGVDAVVSYSSRGCNPLGNYTQGSVYQKNLNLLFSNLSSRAPVIKFYNYTVGNNPDKVYGLFLCRGDLSLEVCRECVKAATQKIVQVCPLFGEAFVWYYECMLRYANRNIFSLSETSPSASLWSTTLVSNYDEFAPILANTMSSLISDAALSSPSAHFATREANLTLFNRLYSLAQCTPDLTEFRCNSCLRSALSEMSACCNASIRVMVSFPSCQLRYDTSPFYNVALPTPSPPNNSGGPGEDKSGGLGEDKSRGPDKKLKTPAIAGIAVAGSIGTLLLLSVIWICLHRKKPVEVPKELPTVKADGTDSLGDVDFLQYDFATMKAATEDFSFDNKLGEGGFGVVYKGTLKSGQEVAIKRLSDSSGQGEREFMSEARFLAKLQHRNLVKLLGFSTEGEEKLLVYEFLPNTSLDRFLFDPTKQVFLEWDMRQKIALGIAKGLQYLHEDSRLTIIHRDLKTSNILLDGEMSPKIADFGLAKLFGGEQKYGNTSRVVGTHGYMAPEYVLTGEYSTKSDVYSFGVIVLEIVSGQKSRMFYQSPQREDLPRYAWRLWNGGQAFELADPKIQNSCSKSEVMRCIQIALLCVQGKAVNRPSMAAVVLMLTGSVALPLPSGPEMSLQRFNVPIANDNVPRAGRHSGQYDLDQSTTKSVSGQTDVEPDLYPR